MLAYLSSNKRFILVASFIFIVSKNLSAHACKSPAAITLTFSVANQTPYLQPPLISGVINDPTDPAANIGIRLDVQENGIDIPASNYTIQAVSSKTSVVTNANVIINSFTGYCIARIKPTGVGYTNIKFTLTKGTNTATVTVKYAASDSSLTPTKTYFHSGISDASAAIAIDSNYMLIGDDEINSLFVYRQKQSGLPVAKFDYQNLLALTDGTPGNYAEIDLEACTKSKTISNRIYWMSSLGTAGSANSIKPNINRIFATDISGTGATTSIQVKGYYSNIRNELIAWGNLHGYNFSSSAAAGHNGKTIDGFNVEGMCFAPNQTDLWIAFRAPLVPITNRTKAVIAPIVQFENWFNQGNPVGSPTIGTPIELDLGGRGIRDLIQLSSGKYLIVAGNYDNTPLKGALFIWDGNASHKPTLLSNMPITNLNAECAVEIVENNAVSLSKLYVISDNGSYVYYNDGKEAKDLTENNYKKFRADVITSPTQVLYNNELYLQCMFNQLHEMHWLAKATVSQQLIEANLQGSHNGIDFITIQTIPTMSWPYQFTSNAVASTYSYYRLKGLTKDAEWIYSNIVKKSAVYNDDITLNPQPSNGRLYICSNKSIIKEASIINSTGQTCLTQKNESTQLSLFTQQLPNGKYTVKLVLPHGVVYKPILISH